MPIKRILVLPLRMVALFMAPVMIGMVKAMIELRGRELFNGLARGLKQARDHWREISN